MITLDDIKKYKEIGTKIDNLVKEYYEKFICCDGAYEYLGWELNDKDEITITYSYIDSYNGERCFDYITLTFDEIYDEILSPTASNKYSNFYHNTRVVWKGGEQ